MKIANRTQEIKLFQSIIQGNFPQRVLLIKAKSGFGKTWLLAQFKHTLPASTLSVQVDLRTAYRGIASIFSSVCKKLGQERFPKLNDAVQRYLSAGVEISDTTMIGQDQQFSVVLTNVDKETRDFRLTQLREAFFQDLRTIRQKMVFLFDSYEQAPTELAGWLEGEFLAEVVDTSQLIVVIAGQEIPKATIEWMDIHHCCCLGAILDREAWYKYTQYKQLSLNSDHVWAVMNVLEGNPAEIDIMLATLARVPQ